MKISSELKYFLGMGALLHLIVYRDILSTIFVLIIGIILACISTALVRDRNPFGDPFSEK
jgi:hypothetical protein